MKILGIIPARYASTRFPGKPLVQIDGKSMIQRVYEQAKKAQGLTEVVVATDDNRIADEIRSFGGNFIITSDTHLSGTDRCAEVIGAVSGFDVVINIQGDEPYIDPSQIELLISCFRDKDVKLATLIKKISAEDDLFNVNIPKVLINARHQAIYFSRQTIPYVRGTEQDQWMNKHQFYKHIGIYGYTCPTLLEITQLPTTSLEAAESLEQLRWIENGYSIQTKITEIETISIDTPEDLNKINL